MKKLNSLKILALSGTCLFLSSCNPDLEKSKSDTDKKVYKIIDNTWQKNELSDQDTYRIDVNTPSKSVNIYDYLDDDGSTLTLNSALSLAIVNSREYQTQKEELYLKALDQVQVEHIYEGSWLVNTKSNVAKSGDEKSTGNSGSVVLNKLLATGAKMTSGISIGFIDIISGDLRSGLSVVASTAITQPLLRGAGRKIALENLTQSQRNTLYGIRAFNRFRQAYVTDIISAYYDILLKYELQRNAQEHYAVLNDLVEKLKVRAKAGRIASHELEQANQDAGQAMTDYITAKREYEDALDAFRYNLVIPADIDLKLDTSELALLQEYIQSPLLLSEEQAIELALTQRLDLLNAADVSDDAERKVEVAADSIRAELNLVGYAQAETSNRSTYGASATELRSTRQQYSLALELDLPFDRVAEISAYRQSVIEVARAQREQQQLTEKIALDIRENFRKLQENKEIYKNETKGLVLASERSANTEALLKYGRASTRDLLDARKDLLQAQDQAATAMVNYALSNLKLLNDAGIIKIKNDRNWQNNYENSMTLAK